MNKKIFTLLASALMLFSTAFTVNAKIIGGTRSIGDTVRTLPKGVGYGLYHIRIDSIYLAANAISTGSPATAKWFGKGDAEFLNYFGVDTVVVGVNESGRVIPVDIADLRNDLKSEYLDLQATMWCVNLEVEENSGNRPTYHFTNKVFREDLDFSNDMGYIGGSEEKGWMYSFSYDNGQLNHSRQIYRYSESPGKFTVLRYNPTGDYIYASERDIQDFTNDVIPFLLKFTIMEVSPIVLDAKAFNTMLGDKNDNELIRLKFNPETNSTDNPNYFSYPLLAKQSVINNTWLNTVPTTSTGKGALSEQYLNLYINGSDTTIYNVINGTTSANESARRYTNVNGQQHIKIHADGNFRAANDNNHYRFVYFPSKDSLVINAYAVRHVGYNSTVKDSTYADLGNYRTDVYSALNPTPIYWGLYNETIHDHLIVRRQDITSSSTSNLSLMTIGKHPANTRISFGFDGCVAMERDAWMPEEGVYTIWDGQGRVLGIRIYNGSLTPQWFYPEIGECPDRIPSYQWVVEKSNKYNSNVNSIKTDKRINITNREFGDQPSVRVRMNNVLVLTKPSKIFQNQSQFKFGYDPLLVGTPSSGFVPIDHGVVTGAYLTIATPQSCDLTSSSGFRLVNTEYTKDPHLGYKFFNVDTDINSVGYGKSEDMDLPGNAVVRGMDYNAFAFNYHHGYDYDKYLSLTTMKPYTNNNDSVLFVDKDGGLEVFQFMLGTELREASNGFRPETFGYPTSGYTNGLRNFTITNYLGSRYVQQVAQLSRYYYELKVADYYDYRDGLSEQYVVLKGAGTNERYDPQNTLKYGVANVWADYDPFKFANVYLRETFFMKQAELKGKTFSVEETNGIDPSRRIYYAILDRIDVGLFNRLKEMGTEIADTLTHTNYDGSSVSYNVVLWGVDETNPYVWAHGKTVSAARVTTFALERIDYDLYRRLCSMSHDGAIPEGGGDGAPMPYDAPKTLKFYTQNNSREFLFEDARSAESANKGANFLGLANAVQFPEDFVSSNDDNLKFNYNIFVDTAYINRGTGPIKPQYLLAVGADIVKDKVVVVIDDCDDEVDVALEPYIRARYLVNATDSAREIGSNASNTYPIKNGNYIYSGSWDRLVFVDAIHVDDRLYLLDMIKGMGVPRSAYIVKAKDGNEYIDASALRKMTQPGGYLYGTERVPGNKYMLGTYYDFGVWNNYHNDVSFSLRYTDPKSKNPSEFTGTGGTPENRNKSFWIESETTNRNPYGNRKIAPVQGGWIKIDNGAAVLSRTSYADGIAQGEIFNVEKPTGPATGTDVIDEASPVKVVAGFGEISVMNANGKNLTITNLLGQTIVNKVLDSDNVTVNAPKGMVILTVEGEKTVKLIVK